MTQHDAGPQRLPFAAAEALLWGPELKKQHRWLLQQMRELTTQYEHYDARIRMAEVVAEAAEAAIARIHHMEKKVAAIEAGGKENHFGTCTMAEIDQLKAFRDDNKNVWQKQNEMYKVIAGLADQVDKMKHAPNDLTHLAMRVELLEARKKEDEDCIKSLQREVVNLRSMRLTSTTLQNQERPVPRFPSSSVQAMTSPRKSIMLEVDVNSETEDEDLIILPKSEQQQAMGRVSIPGHPEVEQ